MTQHLKFSKLIQEFAFQISQNDLYLVAIEQQSKVYNFKAQQLRYITPKVINKFFKSKISKLQEQSKQGTNKSTHIYHKKETQSWQPNQFRMFSWISICYAYIYNKELANFNYHDLLFLQIIFQKKNVDFLEYNLMCLQKRYKYQSKQWETEEIQLLRSINQQSKFQGKWNDISFELFVRSGKRYYKNSHKCRQKWINHLDTTVNKQKWKKEEDILLFELANEMGTKWARISKAMKGVKTEHMVKNRFNSIIKKYHSKLQKSNMKTAINYVYERLREQKQLILSETSVQVEQSIKNEQNCDCQYLNSENINFSYFNIQQRQLDNSLDLDINPNSSFIVDKSGFIIDWQFTHHNQIEQKKQQPNLNNFKIEFDIYLD